MSTAVNTCEIVLKVTDGNGSAVVARVQRELKKLGEEGANAGKKISAGGHESVSGTQAASAAIRVFQGDMTHMIRAVERFVSLSPTVSNALKAAFPVIGAIGLGAVLVTTGAKLAQFIETARRAPKQIEDAFREMTIAGQLSNDELALSNAKLDETIAKLQHKPQNTIAVALLEATVQADKFGQALDQDYQKVNSLLDSNKISILQGIVSGQAGTAYAQGTVSSYFSDISHLGSQYQHAVATHDDAGAQKYLAQLHAKQDSALGKFNSEVSTRRSADTSGGNKQDANIGIYQAAADIIQQQRDRENLTNANNTKQAQADQLQAAKTLAEQRKQDAQKAAAARLKAIQDQYASKELASPVPLTSNDKYAFFDGKQNLFDSHSDEYKQVLDTLAQAHAENTRGNFEALQETSQVPGGLLPNILDGFGNRIIPKQLPTPSEDLSKDTGSITTDGHAATEHIANLQKIIEINQQASDSQKQYAIENDAATGSISRMDAAQQQAALHTEQYARAREQLTDAIAATTANSAKLDPTEQAAALSKLKAELDELDANHSLQSREDATAIDSTSLLTQWRQSLALFVQASRDTAAQIGSIFTDSLQSVNGSLTQALTGHYRTNRDRLHDLRQGLSDDARGVSGKITNAGLEKVEGGALSALGLGGKPDGSSNNPWYVRMVNSLGATGSSIAGTASGLLGRAGSFFGLGHSTASSVLSAAQSAGADGVDTNTSTSALASIASIPLQGFFANGGDVVANRPAIVGERGPEVIVPRTAGTVISNDRAFGSGDTHYHVTHNIDARGSSDPAQTQAMIDRSLRSAYPQMIAGAQQYHQQFNQRRPSSQRQ